MVELTAHDYWNIRQLLDSYSQCLDEGDLEGFLACFAEGGSFEGLQPPHVNHTGPYVGVQGLTQLCQEVAERTGGMSRHLIVGTRMKAVEGGVRSISNCLVTSCRPTVAPGSSTAVVLATGLYFDELVAADGGWLIQRRRFGKEPRQPVIDGVSHSQWLMGDRGNSVA